LKGEVTADFAAMLRGKLSGLAHVVKARSSAGVRAKYRFDSATDTLPESDQPDPARAELRFHDNADDRCSVGD
jgi:hypothetical protein